VNEIVERASWGKLVTYEDKKILRDRIDLLQERLIEKYPQVEPPLKHTFSPGVYARELFIPQGSLIVGKIHRHENMNIISKGNVSVFSIDGAAHFEAPHTFVASPGVKRVIYAHEDTVWTTIHGTHETDLEKIEAEFIAKDYDEIYLSTNRTLDDVLNVLGFTYEQLKRISENEADQIEFPDKVSVEVKASPIHGKGIFATIKFFPGDVIGPARLDSKRTPLGRYSNHGKPNAHGIMRDNGDVDVVALTYIEVGDEVLTDYYFNFTKSRG